MSRSARASGSMPNKGARPKAKAAGAAFLSRLFDHVRDGVVGADLEYRITYWSTGAERLYGFTSAEALGRTTLDLLRPVYEPGEREKIIDSIDTLGSYVATLRTRHKNGTEIVVEVNSSRLTDERGAASGYVVVYRDVTQRARDRQALKEANDLLLAQSDELRRRAETMRAILNATQESICQFGRDGRVLLANDIALRRMRLPADAVLGRHVTELLPPELAALRLAKLGEAVESRRVVEFEDERAGMTFRHSFYPVLDRDGNVASVVSFSRDITERKKVEADLDESRKKYRAIIETANDFIWETDARGHYTYCSPQMETLWGIRPESMLGKTPFDIMTEADRTAGFAQFQELLRAAKPFVGLESVAVMPDGRTVTVETNGVPFFDEHGNLQGFRGITRDITERKKVDAALRESEAKASALIKYAPTGIYEIDFRGPRFLSVNDAMCRILGYTREELMAIPPMDLLDEASRTRFADRIRRQMSGEAIDEIVEYRVRRKDGVLLSALLNVVVSPTPEDPYKVFVIAHDITALKRMEEEIRLSRAEAERRGERFELLSLTAARLLETDDPQDVVDGLCRKILEHLDCQVFFNFLVDRTAGRLRLNACGGIPESEIPGLQWLDFGAAVCGYVAQNAVRVVAEDIPAHPGPRTDLVAGFGVKAYACHPLMAGSEVLGTLSFGAKNRTRFTADELALMKTVADQVAVAIERMRDQQALRERGEELQRLAESLDLRVRKRTAELAAANDRLRAEASERVRLVAAIEQASEGVAIMDDRGRISYANASFAGLSGRDLGEIVSMSYSDFLGGGDTWAAIRASLDRGEAWRGRLSRTRADGDKVELEAIVSPIQDAEGRGINCLAVERDVTREVRLQDHLRQVQKMEALGTLAGGIAHDFNNILNPIFISTELLLLDAALDPADRRHLEVTLKAAERGRDLVKQIIAFSRRKDKEHKPFEAAPVVGEVVKFLRVSLPSTIEIRSDIRRDAGLVLGDPAQVHQIVMNLCNNAAYAMRDHGGILTVSLMPEDVDAGRAAAIPGLKPGPQLRLTVSDTGVGMIPEVRERAFDPFFTTKKPGEGSGMGLAVVDGIVRDYGGTVTVETETGRGSTFTVYLPRQVHQIMAEDEEPESPPRGSERVLLLDDEDVQVRSIRGMLERLGYKVTGFTDGVEALARFRADPRAFDLVITDQTMPQMTGVKVASEILKLRPGMPIVLCTGFSETVDALEAKAQGIREFLMKPYSILEMAVTVRRALSGRPAKAKAKRP